MWAWAHNTSMYGCLNIPASKLFDPKDAEIAIYYGDEVLKNCTLIFYSVRDGRTKIKSPPSQKDARN